MYERRHEVVAGSAAPPLDEAADVVVESDDAVVGALLAFVGHRPREAFVGTDHEFLDLVAITLVDPEEYADAVQRNVVGVVGDHIHLARLGHRIEQSVRMLAHERTHPLHLPWRERPADERPQAARDHRRAAR